MNQRIELLVYSIDPVNAEFILADHNFESKIDSYNYFETKNDQKMVGYMIEEMTTFVSEYNDKNLTPANVEIGDGVTIHLWSDSHAATVIKTTKTSVTVQRDKATIDPNFKPDFVVGGFAGHCTNQNDQKYTYEQDPNGQTYTFRWSKKYNRYQNGGKSGLTLYKGRHEFYDYNF